jgi:hypothetical protein
LEFNRTLEKEILPLLQKQKGFRDELILVALDASEVIGISIWDQKENMDAYHHTSYPEVQKLLAKMIDPTPRAQTYQVIEGTPRVQIYEVSTSTIHKVAARAVSG